VCAAAFGWVPPRAGRAVMKRVLVLMLIGYLAARCRATSRGIAWVVRKLLRRDAGGDSVKRRSWCTPHASRHGTINHGEEYLNPAPGRSPGHDILWVANTGVGIAIRRRQRTRTVRVGVFGLGTGTVG